MERVWCVTSNTLLSVSLLLALSDFLFFSLISSSSDFVGFLLIWFSLGLFISFYFFPFPSPLGQWIFKSFSIYYSLCCFQISFLEWLYPQKSSLLCLQRRVRLYCSIQRMIKGNYSYFLADFSFSLSSWLRDSHQQRSKTSYFFSFFPLLS